jgi:predicted NAD-dependent protein-ADP-ribosyltransferase YbiA (DUF1768 family)
MGRETQITIPFSSAEHAYQASKFNGTSCKMVYNVINAPDALTAKKRAAENISGLTLDLEEEKRYDLTPLPKDHPDHYRRLYFIKLVDDHKRYQQNLDIFFADGNQERIMLSVLRAKFGTNPILKAALLATGKAVMAEVPGRSSNIWAGRGGLLGKLLMQVRSELKT